MPDIYDQQIEEILASPNVPKTIEDHWSMSLGIFAFVGPSNFHDEKGRQCGCLTMIRNHPNKYCAFPTYLTEEIAKDERLPKGVDEIRPEHLPVFAEWRRKIDQYRKA